MNQNNEILIENFLVFINDVKKFSHHTIRSYKNDLNQFLIFLKQYDEELLFVNIDKSVIQQYIQKISKSNLNDKTILRKVSTIKSFYKFLMINGLISFNVMDLIPSPKTTKRIPGYLSIKEIKLLMSLPDLSTYKGNMHRSILELFYSTGMRLSELVSIERHNINFKKRIIKILGKGNKQRIVILGNEALKALKNYLNYDRHSNSQYIYPSLINEKNHLSVNYVYKMVKKYLSCVSKNEKLSPHSLRHSFATHLLNEGADLMSVKDLLGHEDLSSTQVYTHVTLEKIKKIYKLSHPYGKK
ncbi:MAG: hypothetical protein CMG64_04965 [Candidatus Marinimicrobia bacterium]|nr:hypothetical protein [Candidatus Neomarinimicrobiota bacterium]|tara:strand:- start:118 stop:1017 length:900 start_codon:yes stop_codon:yes gene_type:complete